MDSKIIKDIWNCVANSDPVTWALGDQHGSEMKNVRAMVWRRPDGAWQWDAGISGGGKQPSRETAIEAAEASLANK